MALREVVTIPDEVLRRKAHKVTNFDKDLSTLIDDMFETMRQAPGVGLAAPQIDISQRVIVVEYAEEEEEKPKSYAVINPEIIKTSTETELGIEGCLSIPNLVGEVERFSTVVVKGFNKQGKPVKIKSSGWLARIFQHEIDHLEGILFTDRATRIWQPPQEETAELPE
ncbi:MAG: peptide deformylase [Chloroflexi bacterium HGW-Chloroflexi-2]|jgi:peptide deformylase|nr:MAG: peptide deformylase [Chloroflexi bacterium HGW-Chloroflexi-2]